MREAQSSSPESFIYAHQLKKNENEKILQHHIFINTSPDNKIKQEH